MATKDFNSDIGVTGNVVVSGGVQDSAGGSATQFWKTDGTKGAPIDSIARDRISDVIVGLLYYNHEFGFCKDVADDLSDLTTKLDAIDPNQRLWLIRQLNGLHRVVVERAFTPTNFAGCWVTFADHFYDTSTLQWQLGDKLFQTELGTTITVAGDSGEYDTVLVGSSYGSNTSLWSNQARPLKILSLFRDEAAASGGLTEADVIGTTRQYTRQQNFSEQQITDAVTLTWDLDTQQVAYLQATGAVGVTRTLPNSVLLTGVSGGNYVLTFIQDATGSRNITFDTNFEAVIGSFNSAPNSKTIVNLFIHNGKGIVVLTDTSGNIISGVIGTGTELDLSRVVGTNYHYNTPSNNVTWTWVNPVINGFARVFINTTTKPTVTGATEVHGSPWVSGEVMEMVVESPNGVAAEYYFLRRAL